MDKGFSCIIICRSKKLEITWMSIIIVNQQKILTIQNYELDVGVSIRGMPLNW